ncbi:MAG: hypothetical protein QOE61_517 [Micromonosporaceae bacterium]|nr:hypothetical protein [Micromonosporaceae bacterium]
MGSVLSARRGRQSAGTRTWVVRHDWQRARRGRTTVTSPLRWRMRRSRPRPCPHGDVAARADDLAGGEVVLDPLGVQHENHGGQLLGRATALPTTPPTATCQLVLQTGRVDRLHATDMYRAQRHGHCEDRPGRSQTDQRARSPSCSPCCLSTETDYSRGRMLKIAAVPLSTCSSHASGDIRAARVSSWRGRGINSSGAVSKARPSSSRQPLRSGPYVAATQICPHRRHDLRAVDQRLDRFGRLGRAGEPVDQLVHVESRT